MRLLTFFSEFCHISVSKVLKLTHAIITNQATGQNWSEPYAHCTFLFVFPVTGVLHEEYLREILTTLGDRFTHDEVDDMYKEAPIQNNYFDYVEFTRILKHGAKDPDE